MQVHLEIAPTVRKDLQTLISNTLIQSAFSMNVFLPLIFCTGGPRDRSSGAQRIGNTRQHVTYAGP